MRFLVFLLFQLFLLHGIPTVLGVSYPSRSWSKDIPTLAAQPTGCIAPQTITVADLPNFLSADLSQLSISFEAEKVDDCGESDDVFFAVTNTIEGVETEIWRLYAINVTQLSSGGKGPVAAFQTDSQDPPSRLLIPFFIPMSGSVTTEYTAIEGVTSNGNYESLTGSTANSNPMKYLLSVNFADKTMTNWIIGSSIYNYTNSTGETTDFGSGTWRFDSTFKIYLGSGMNSTDSPMSYSFSNLKVEYQYMNQLGDLAGAAVSTLLGSYSLSDGSSSGSLSCSEGTLTSATYTTDSAPTYPTANVAVVVVTGGGKAPPTSSRGAAPFYADVNTAVDSNLQAQEDGADRILPTAQPSWGQDGYLQFTANTQFISLPITTFSSEDGLSIIKSISMTFWVKLSITQDSVTQLVLLDDTSAHLGLYRDSNGYIAYAFTGSVATATTTPLPLEEWTLISFYFGVFSNNPILQLYVGETLAFTTEVPGNSVFTASDEVTAKFVVGGFVGEVKDLKIYGPGSQPSFLFSSSESTTTTTTTTTVVQEQSKGNVVVIATLCGLAGVVLIGIVVFLHIKKRLALKAAKAKKVATYQHIGTASSVTPPVSALRNELEVVSP